MPDSQAELSSAEARAIVEEEGLLKRTQEALTRALKQASVGSSASGWSSQAALRALRSEAMTASEDDQPMLLHELHLRQALAEKPLSPLPDPACPYLAHLRLREGESRKPDYLLGSAAWFEDGVRIVDWRVAPIAQIFYEHREGDAFEQELPGRLREGSVEVRRIVVIEKGILLRILGDGMVLEKTPDGTWRRASNVLGSLSPGGGGSAARNGVLGVGVGRPGRAAGAPVTALLDAAQYAAVTGPAHEALLVLGSAGSGKTTVALHRLLRMDAHQKADGLSESLVVVPEEGLARLSRRLLEPLRAEPRRVQTLDEWAIGRARMLFGVRLPALCDDAPGVVIALKRSPALYRALMAYFSKRRQKTTTMKALLRRLREIFTDREFLSRVVLDARGALPGSAIEECVRHTLLQLAEAPKSELAHITASELKRGIDGRALADGTPTELGGSVDVEELPILIFLKTWLDGTAPELTHLVVDEAEDFSPFEIFVLGKLLNSPGSLTLAGDEAQTTTSAFGGWPFVLDTVGAGDARVCRLSVSYRCPEPIVEFAERLLPASTRETPVTSERVGAPVGAFGFPTQDQADLFIANAAWDLLDREPSASVAVIAASRDAARRFHVLAAQRPGSRLVLNGEFGFEPGLDVTHVDAVKGLEFDYVIVPDATAFSYPDTREARHRLHVVATRAAHQLWVLWGGERSPLVDSFG